MLNTNQNPIWLSSPHIAIQFRTITNIHTGLAVENELHSWSDIQEAFGVFGNVLAEQFQHDIEVSLPITLIRPGNLKCLLFWQSSDPPASFLRLQLCLSAARRL